MNQSQIPWPLIIGHLKNILTDSEEEKFRLWNKDERNQSLYTEIYNVWVQIQKKEKNYLPEQEYYWKKLSNRIHEYAQNKELSENKKKPLFRFWALKYAAIWGLLFVSTVSLSYYMGYNKIVTPNSQSQTYHNYGGKSAVTLPDGTQVWLHSASSISYNHDFNKKKRLVSISGEAYFEVAYNKQKPFLVNLEGLTIEVHGTKFNVTTLPHEECIYVSLTEGSVALKTISENRFLEPGEIGTYHKKNNQLNIHKGDVAYHSSWAKEEYVFNNASLKEVTHILEKWYRTEIIVCGDMDKSYSYSFTLKNEPLDEITRLMERVSDIDCVFTSDNQLIIKQNQMPMN